MGQQQSQQQQPLSSATSWNTGPGSGMTHQSGSGTSNCVSGGGGGGRGSRPPHAPLEGEIERLIEDRNEARKGGNFAAADDIRDHLKRLGVVLMDEKGARGNRRGLQVTRWRYWNP